MTKKVGKIQMVEIGGRTIISQLSNQAPWTKEPLGRQACMACMTKPGICKKLNSTHQLECMKCKQMDVKRVYIGETSKFVFDRVH